MQMARTIIFPSIQNLCQDLMEELHIISEPRKNALLRLSGYIIKKYQHQKTPKITVICTHNSRRSHLGQIWLAVAAQYFELPKIETYSGGTEATAFNPRAVSALQLLGFKIVRKKGVTTQNPLYEVRWSGEGLPYPAFSKRYNTAPNPTDNFAAIMVCNEADRGCPLVAGADFRIALPFEDPKLFDGTALEKEKYVERARQIGREMLYVMQAVRVKL